MNTELQAMIDAGRKLIAEQATAEQRKTAYAVAEAERLKSIHYHWICICCGAVRHRGPGIDPGECECGGSSWKQRQVRPTGEPWYAQLLDPACPICQRTANELRAMTAQMELFAL